MKPGFQWETREHRARRLEALPEAWEGRPRAEAFELEFADGRRGRIVCGLERQEVDEVGATDPALSDCVGAWLVARGARQIDLRAPGERVLRKGPVGPADLGDPVPVTAPRRIVTLAPSNLEMVHALGAFERVVACESSSDFPPEVKGLERLGPDLGPDLDRIAALAPDLVIASLTVPGMERNVSGLWARGIPQLVLAPRSLRDVLGEVRRTAAHLHAEAEGERLVGAMEAEMAALRERRPATPARVYLEWWPRPMFTPGSDCYSNQLIELAGGVNVFGDRPGSSLEIGPDELVAARPDLCFVSWCGVPAHKLDPSRLRDRAGLEALDAARAGRVYALDEAFAGRPGPRMLEAARRMAEKIAALG